MEAIRAERDRIVNEYAELLPTDEDREAFQGKLGLARVVFPYVENHNFYVEHWSHSVIWRKMRQLGELLVKEGFWSEANDIFFLKRTEVEDALWDYYASWATPAPAAGPGYWPPGDRAPRGIHAALSAWKPTPALGVPPEVITEPFTVMLWGITSEQRHGVARRRRRRGRRAQRHRRLARAWSRARRASSSPPTRSARCSRARSWSPRSPRRSWAPIFGKIEATVTDTGGMMSHAAIVCREYGLPAVTGTGFATSTITTGHADPRRRLERHRHHPRAVRPDGSVGREVPCPPDGTAGP